MGKISELPSWKLKGFVQHCVWTHHKAPRQDVYLLKRREDVLFWAIMKTDPTPSVHRRRRKDVAFDVRNWSSDVKLWKDVRITFIICAQVRRAPHEVFLKKGVPFQINLATNFKKMCSSYMNLRNSFFNIFLFSILLPE